jgi:hypothetical protein
MKLSTSGAAINTPSVSPSHQVNQVEAAPASGTTPSPTSAGVATLGLMVQASRPPSRPASTMSRGACKTTSGPVKRRSRAAPARACSAAPSAIKAGNVSRIRPSWPRSMPAMRLTAKAPKNTPGAATRPQLSTAARPMPADGYSGDA